MSRFTFSGCGVVLAALAVSLSAGAEDTATARARYQEGARLYNAGQYEQALRAFEEAYALSGAKPLLFNIAQAHRLAGPSHCEQALRAYESYLREDITASNRSEVEERIVEMQSCVEHTRQAESQRATASERAAKPTPAPPTEPPKRPNGPIIVGVAGGGLLLVGAGLYAAARIKFNHERTNCPCPEGTFSTWEGVTTASYILLATGGAAAVAGASWWRASPVHRSYALTATPAGLYLSGSF